MIELREHPRVMEQAEVSISIESAPEAASLVGKVYTASTIDISLRGLRLLVDDPVPVGSRIALTVNIGKIAASHRHSSIVIWDHPLFADEGEKQLHTIGIQLESDDDPQFDAWRETVYELYKSNEVS